MIGYTGTCGCGYVTPMTTSRLRFRLAKLRHDLRVHRRTDRTAVRIEVES